MEGEEECKNHNQMMKRKRTKRQRPASPLALTMACSSSSDPSGGGSGGSSDRSVGFDRPTNSGEKVGGEEEEMASCLMLLARGRTRDSPEQYQCKTCERRFPSFQALGGHRASHKKPKGGATVAEEKKPQPAAASAETEHHKSNCDFTDLSLRIPSRISCAQSNKSRVHECSFCGAEFTSGQALGGHMRRHRPIPVTASGVEGSISKAKKPGNLLALDLNLPAPEDDRRESKFSFAAKEQVIVFSASPLVDCHY